MSTFLDMDDTKSDDKGGMKQPGEGDAKQEKPADDTDAAKDDGKADAHADNK